MSIPLFLLVCLAFTLAATHLTEFRQALTEPRCLCLAFAGVFVLHLLNYALQGLPLAQLDRPSRFLLALAWLPIVLLLRPRAAFLWTGAAAGALVLLAVALQQMYLGDVYRPNTYHFIVFGDTAILLGLLSLAGVGQLRAWWKRLLLLTGLVAGVAVSVVSQSRGGWAALLLAFLPLWVIFRIGACAKLLISAALIAVLTAGVVFFPHSPVGARIREVGSDIQAYQDGMRNTSIGIRFELWRASWLVFSEHPMLGLGEHSYAAAVREKMAGRGLDDKNDYSHAHNDVIDAAAKRGLVGVAALLLAYLAPLLFFARRWREAAAGDAEDEQLFAATGMVVVLAYILFGLTEVMFIRQVGTAFYANLVAILAGYCVLARRLRLSAPA
ncbi:MAG: O-antigen ligase family protein [Candidatus Protistobacter heckmanni]|nr:O-antigen ligase family protein [Candidatus Protistobacter heckmanni]